MIRTEAVRSISDSIAADLSYYGQNDYAAALLSGMMPDRLWVIYVNNISVLVFGIQAGTLLAGRTVWMLTCKAFPRHIFTLLPWIRRNVRRLARVVGPLRIYVEESYVPAMRFAKAAGFVPSVRKGECYVLCEAS